MSEVQNEVDLKVIMLLSFLAQRGALSDAGVDCCLNANISSQPFFVAADGLLDRRQASTSCSSVQVELPESQCALEWLRL